MNNGKRLWKNEKRAKYLFVEQWCESCDLVYSDDDYNAKRLKINTVNENSIQTKSETGVCTRSGYSYDPSLNPFNFGATPISSFSLFTIRKSLQDENATRKQVSRQSSGDSGVETDSIFSFASKLDESSGSILNDAFSVSRSSMSSDNFSSSSSDSWEFESVANCRGTSLPTVKNDAQENDVHIPHISIQTLAGLLQGEMNIKGNVLLIDCRFPYEYDAGHITNAVNIYTCQKLLQYLFHTDNKQQLRREMASLDLTRLQRDDTIYIFYCEFSSFRGPKLAQCLRGLDRLANMHNSKNLFIPNIYILQSGYSQFHRHFRGLCYPDDYVGMKQVTYSLRNEPYSNIGASPPLSQHGSQYYRKQQKVCETEMRNSEKVLRDIVARRTNNCDILKLFSVHPHICAPL